MYNNIAYHYIAIHSTQLCYIYYTMNTSLISNTSGTRYSMLNCILM